MKEKGLKEFKSLEWLKERKNEEDRTWRGGTNPA